MPTPVGPWTSHGYLIPGQAAPVDAQPPKVARCGGPGLCDRCSLESLEFAARMPERPTLAKNYEQHTGEFPRIDGDMIPWMIHADGARVEPIPGAGMHILWLPVLIDAPLPEYAHKPPGDSIKE